MISLRFEKKQKTRINYILAIIALLFTNNTLAAISVRDRCEMTLKMMGVETSGTERGWASLCAGLIENETITRYGNWYGPGYWGGSEDPSKAGLKAPLDSLDEVAMRHDYGYLVAEKYGKIYGKKYEYKLKAIADMLAVKESMQLAEDPNQWPKPPVDAEKASHYRDRIITGFIMESEIYKGLSDATKVGDAITSPFITWFDQIDYSHIPDIDKFKREVSSHINGWKKDVENQKNEEKKAKQQAEKEKQEKAEKEKKEREKAEMKKLEQESNAKREKDAKEAKKRLEKKIAESKQETKDAKTEKKKSYAEMTPEERHEALKQNDEEAWDAFKKELQANVGSDENPEETQPENQTAKSSVDIPPVKITASASFDEDYSSGEFKNIVTTTVSLAFWNVGSQVPGYEGVTMTSKAVSSLNGSTYESSCPGTFSGGPNGTIRLYGGCAGTTLSLKNGSSITMDEVTLNVSNPSAFSYWK